MGVQDLENVGPKSAIVKIFGIKIFKGDHNILNFLRVLVSKRPAAG